MILAGDIGGTNSRIALFEEDQDGTLQEVYQHIYPSRSHNCLEDILALFLSEQRETIDCACFGVAGPVVKGEVAAPNLAWIVNAVRLAQAVGLESVWLINDLHAHACGVDDLKAEDFVALNRVEGGVGNSAVIAAGTGLGEAGLYWDGANHWAFPCEGGHTDFAPRNDIEIALLRYLLNKFGRVSYERVVSGRGLVNIYNFLRDTGKEDEPEWLKDELRNIADPAPLISQYGVQAKTPICEAALDIFVSVYGAEAGNLALKFMATGGVFLSGGIAVKILPKLTGTEFIEAFVTKGRLQPVLTKIPVKVIVNDKVGLIGAARYAERQYSSANPLFSSLKRSVG
jgi:glucokinase